MLVQAWQFKKHKQNVAIKKLWGMIMKGNPFLFELRIVQGNTS